MATIRVNIDPWDILPEINTIDLCTELLSRKHPISALPSDRSELRDIISQTDGDTAVRLERIFFPKFASPELAQEAYQRAMQEKAA